MSHSSLISVIVTKTIRAATEIYQHVQKAQCPPKLKLQDLERILCPVFHALKPSLGLALWCAPLIPVLGKQEQEDFCEARISLVYRVNSIERPCLTPFCILLLKVKSIQELTNNCLLSTELNSNIGYLLLKIFLSKSYFGGIWQARKVSDWFYFFPC